jgi:hypothetical protein
MAKRRSVYDTVIELILLGGAIAFVLLLAGVDLGLKA